MILFVLGACLGSGLSDPALTEDRAFSLAGVPRTAQQRDVRYSDALFGNGRVALQFELPATDVPSFADAVGCTLVPPPDGHGTSWPFALQPGLSGWLAEILPGSVGCVTRSDEPEQLVRQLRVSPATKGRATVQILVLGP